MTNNEMTIKVSGVEVYKAVKNYLNNNTLVQNQIQKTLEELINNGYIKDKIRRNIDTYLMFYSGKLSIEKIIKEVASTAVNEALRKQIDDIIVKTIKKSLKNALILNTEDIED